MNFTFGFNCIGTSSKPASMQVVFKFTVFSQMHFDGQKPCAMVIINISSKTICCQVEVASVELNDFIIVDYFNAINDEATVVLNF